MRGVIHLFHAGGGNMGIDLRGGQVGVAQEFLDVLKAGIREKARPDANAPFVLRIRLEDAPQAATADTG